MDGAPREYLLAGSIAAVHGPAPGTGIEKIVWKIKGGLPVKGVEELP
jgi:hypothetical protein